MGWSSVFRSRSAKRLPDPRVRWFGKLPAYADYYRTAGEEDWAIEFNDWLLRGFDEYHRRASAGPFPKSPLAGSEWALRLPKSGMTVLASIQDHGGDGRGRPFPFCLYAGVPTSSWPGPTGDLAVPALQVLRSLTAMHREVAQHPCTPEQVRSAFGDREMVLDDVNRDGGRTSWAAEAASIRLADWFAALGTNASEHDLVARCAQMADWGDRLGQRESRRFKPSLRFPLCAGVPIEAQAAGWLRWLESYLNLRRRRLSLAISFEPEQRLGHLSVIAREADPVDFLLGTCLAGELTQVDSPPVMSATQAASPCVPAEGDAGILDQTWLEFVQGRAVPDA